MTKPNFHDLRSILGSASARQLVLTRDDTLYLREELGVRMSRRDKLTLRWLARNRQTTMGDVIRSAIRREARALVAVANAGNSQIENGARQRLTKESR